jgi:hypothetical protein
MSSSHLFDLPDPLLSQIVHHSKVHTDYFPEIQQPLLSVSRQARDSVLRATINIKLHLWDEDTGAALDPYARLLARASLLAACQELGLRFEEDNGVNPDVSPLLSLCSAWPSVQYLEFIVSLCSLAERCCRAGREMLL